MVFCQPRSVGGATPSSPANAGRCCRALDPAYRVLELCTVILGLSAARPLIWRCWLPGAGAIGKSPAAAICGDFPGPPLPPSARGMAEARGLLQHLNWQRPGGAGRTMAGPARKPEQQGRWQRPCCAALVPYLGCEPASLPN